MSVYSVTVYPSSTTIKTGAWYYGAYAVVNACSNCCRDVEWYSDTPSVATVNPIMGYIYGMNPGTAKIYARSKIDSSKKDYITVTVTSGSICVECVQLNKTSISLEKGDCFTLTATVCPTNATNKAIHWRSTNESVATVSGGVVTAKASGESYIYAEATDGSGVYGSCYVRVTENILVSSVTVDPPEKTMVVGETYCLREVVCPPNATDPRVIWESSNNCVVTVNPASGMVYAQGVGQAVVTATPLDGGADPGECLVTVNPPIAVTCVQVSPTSLTMNVGDTETLFETVFPANATNKQVIWRSSNENVAHVNAFTGVVSANEVGTATITATSQENSLIMDSCIVYCDRLLYEFIHVFGFAEEDAILIRKFYDKVENKYASDPTIYRSWIASRLLGGICYSGENVGMNAQYKWNDVAGKVFSGSEEGYFVNTLGFTAGEYAKLLNVINEQHNDTDTPDFAHMQISLAARLAYKLNLDGVFSNLYTFSSDETISYLAGWLGDATLTNSNGLTSLGDDDYCADLDAENIYRLITSTPVQDIISASNDYYNSLNSNNTRANVFLNYISLDTVKIKVFSAFGIGQEEDPINVIKELYPDTYDFLCSLEDGLANLSNY